MVVKQAEQLRYWLSCSYLVQDAGFDLQTAAETYDEMNDNTTGIISRSYSKR